MRQTQSGITFQRNRSDNAAASLDDLKELLRLDGTTEDDYLEGLLLSASDYAQRYLNLSLLTTQWTRQYDEIQNRGLAMEYFHNVGLSLTYPPVTEVERVYAVDNSGNETEVSNYYNDLLSYPARVFVRSFPATREIATVRVDYTAGYGESFEDVPRLIQQGILQHAAFMYEHRGDCDAHEAQRKSGAIDLYGSYKVQVV